MSLFKCLNQELQTFKRDHSNLNICFLLISFSCRKFLYSKKITQKFLDNLETLVSKNPSWIPALHNAKVLMFSDFFNKQFHTSQRSLHSWQFHGPEVSGVPRVVTTFPPYILKAWNLNQNLPTLNLNWKPLQWNF